MEEQTNEQGAVGDTETKAYEDGTTATGPGPLPDESPTIGGAHMLDQAPEAVTIAPSDVGDLAQVLSAQLAPDVSQPPAPPPSPEALRELLAEAVPVPRLLRLEAARALPEAVEGDDVLGAYTKPDDECIESFVDTDDRVMRVVVTPAGLAKVELHHG
jgi:hypothetical protein